jgi:hypothetical protein
MENNTKAEYIIRMYTSAWNETSPEAILAKIQQSLSPQITYMDNITDPMTGHQAILQFILGSYEQLGPRTFHLLTVPNTHHDTSFYRWLAIRESGYPIVGADIVEFDNEGLIASINGFILTDNI